MKLVRYKVSGYGLISNIYYNQLTRNSQPATTFLKVVSRL